jgi:hypothetical protein
MGLEMPVEFKTGLRKSERVKECSFGSDAVMLIAERDHEAVSFGVEAFLTRAHCWTQGFLASLGTTIAD